MTAELYTPAGTTAKGVIIIAYGSDGLTDHLSGPRATMIRGYANSLVEKGFTAIIPNYLATTETQPGPAVFPQILHHRDDWEEAISDSIDHAKTLATVDATACRSIGVLSGRSSVFAASCEGEGLGGVLRAGI